jgi:hypothetical protein
MTDQSPTAAFAASSFLDGANARAIVAGGKADARSKIQAMKSTAIMVADGPAGPAEAVMKAIGG